jgi:hypothetical protein
MLPDLRRLQSIASDRVSVVLLGISTVVRYDQARQAAGGDLRLINAVAQDPVLKQELDELTELSHQFQIHDSPAALVITPAGTIGSVTATGRLAIEALIRRTLAEAVPVSAPLVATS